MTSEFTPAASVAVGSGGIIRSLSPAAPDPIPIRRAGKEGLPEGMGSGLPAVPEKDEEALYRTPATGVES